MKRVLHLVALLFISVNLFAQAPQKMTYQAVIRNGSNNLITNAPVKMKISILQGSTTGTTVYSELHPATTNANGLVSIQIGEGTDKTGTFSTIDWGNGTYFLRTETDPNGGTNYSIEGISQLLSVPYSLYSNDVFVRVSQTGDTLIIGNGNKIIIPGISSANNLTDASGNTYPTVKIGNQVWMAENLRTTKYRDGSDIPVITSGTQWADNFNNSTTLPMMCWYNNDQATYTVNKFGALYNWYAINPATNGNKNVCPTGWHVPTDAEWTTLTTFLGGESVAGGKLKSTGTQYWFSPNTGATNSSGWSGLPGGLRDNDGPFYDIGGTGNWWSSTESISSFAWLRYLSYDNGSVNRADYDKTDGFSVRCIRD